MTTAAETTLPFPRLSPGEVLGTHAAMQRLDYCLEWRSWLWRKPAKSLLAPFERFRGKRVIEIGARFGKMSCLLASAGADVIGVDVASDAIEAARVEADRWGIADRARFEWYDGDGRHLPPGPFDFILSKSVLGMVRKDHLPDLLAQLRSRLAPGGEGLFLENANSRMLDLIRRHLLHRRETCWNDLHWGFHPANLSVIENAFGPLAVRRFHYLVWAIRGPHERAKTATLR